MLTPEYLNYCSDDAIDLYSKLDEKITRDIARRIVKAGYVTETAKKQILIAQESGLLYEDIVQAVADMSDASKATVKAIFKDAGVESISSDSKIYEAAGKTAAPLKMSEAMLNILNAGITKTDGGLLNLTQTTALAAQDAFINACTLAELQVSTGAFDYNTAIRNAVNDAIEHGAYVTYPSGHIDQLDVAVRRAVLTGVSQTTGEIALANARDLGTNLMELTAHAGARPTHAVWQGQIVCVDGENDEYLTLEDIGYGSVAGFKGANCRHDWFPFLEGISTRAYTDKQIKELNDQTVKYNGEDIGIYDATKAQREMEREMRGLKRQIAGLDEAIKNADNPKLLEDLQTDFYEKSQILSSRRKQYEKFVEGTGLPSDFARAQKAGYNRSISSKAVWANRKATVFDDLVGIKTPVGAQVSEVGIHSRARAMARGVSPQAAADALTNPVKVGKIRADGGQQFVGKNAAVVVNVNTGKVITMWSKVK